MGFQGFVFDGIAMVGLTGNAASLALGYNVDDFRAFYTTDEGHMPIECVIQSHYEDCGLPDNDKVARSGDLDDEPNGDTRVARTSGTTTGRTALTTLAA